MLKKFAASIFLFVLAFTQSTFADTATVPPIEKTKLYEIPVKISLELQIMDDQNRYVSSPEVKLYASPQCHWGDPKMHTHNEDARIVSQSYETVFKLNEFDTLKNLCLSKLALSVTSKYDLEFPSQGLITLQSLSFQDIERLMLGIREKAQEDYEILKTLPANSPDRIAYNGSPAEINIFIQGKGTAFYPADFQLDLRTPKLEVGSILREEAKKYGWNMYNSYNSIFINYRGNWWTAPNLTERDYELGIVPKADSRPISVSPKPDISHSAQTKDNTPIRSRYAFNQESSTEKIIGVIVLLAIIGAAGAVFLEMKKK